MMARMARHQLKLHAAIAAVLVDAGSRGVPAVWLPFEEIARRVADHDLYRRPKDGAYPRSGQVAARVNQYPALFERRGDDPIEVRLRIRDL
jgi:hypothetical protein